MTLFFLVFLSLYGGMHVYAYFRLRSFIRPTITLPACMLFLTIAPLLVRIAEHYGLDKTAYAIALPGFVWMGFIFLFCVLLVTIDTAYLLWRTAKRDISRRAISATICRLAFLLACLASAYSLFEVQDIRTEKIIMHAKPGSTITTPVRVVQISDVHLGLMMDEKRLGKIVTAIRDAKPDILFSTGDLVDGRLNREKGGEHSKELVAMLRTISAPQGKYAIVGNHEYYAGIDNALLLTKSAGFAVLVNETAIHQSGITITGVDDPASKKTGMKVPGSEQELIKKLPNAAFHILLKHRPLLEEGSNGKIDLQLSGHTHKGQLIPFYPLTWLQFPLHSGTTKTENGTTIHVSRGTGTWGPPMRFMAPPEITIIDIVP